MLHLVLEELDQVLRDVGGALVGRRVGRRLVLVVGLQHTHHLLRIHRDRRAADPVLHTHDQIGLPAGRQVGHSDVVQAFETRDRRVDFDDDLLPQVVNDYA